MGRFPSGQREQTVNLPRHASVVRIHPCPPSSAGMAELADAHDSGSCVRTYLQVQVLFPARGALDFQGFRFFYPYPYPYQLFLDSSVTFFHAEINQRIPLRFRVLFLCMLSHQKKQPTKAAFGTGSGPPEPGSSNCVYSQVKSHIPGHRSTGCRISGSTGC